MTPHPPKSTLPDAALHAPSVLAEIRPPRVVILNEVKDLLFLSIRVRQVNLPSLRRVEVTPHDYYRVTTPAFARRIRAEEMLKFKNVNLAHNCSRFYSRFRGIAARIEFRARSRGRKAHED